jgi:hypothetical protein
LECSASPPGYLELWSTAQIQIGQIVVFMAGVEGDPWFALEWPLPDDLDLASLQVIRPIVYALLHALDLTLDEATGLTGG